MTTAIPGHQSTLRRTQKPENAKVKTRVVIVAADCHACSDCGVQRSRVRVHTASSGAVKSIAQKRVRLPTDRVNSRAQVSVGAIVAEPIISRPRAGLLAFSGRDSASTWSQAAQLIGLGVYLSGDEEVIAEMEEEARELLIPRVEQSDRLIAYERLLEYVAETGWREAERFTAGRAGYLSPWTILEEQVRLWPRVRDTSSSGAAFALLNISLYSEHEIVRVAAAAALAPLVENSWPHLESVLVDGCLATDDTPRLLSAHALAILMPEHPALAAMIPPDLDEGTPEPAQTSIAIHGTFARLRSDWYKPGSPFHRYLKRTVSTDLYSGDDYFRWDGRYSDASRQLGADDLKPWLTKHNVTSLDTVFAHSHGGNLALTAIANGVRARLLVLISVPARKRPHQQWQSIFSGVGRVVSLRSRFDLVIYGDRSCQRFQARVRQLLPPSLWFSHGALLRPKVWDRYRLPNEIAYERGMAQIP